jgi:hypothetical protein
VRIAHVEASPAGGGLTRVRCVVENLGYLPTYVLSSSRPLPWNEPLRVELETPSGTELCAGERQQRIGHLEGWGGYDRWTTPVFARSWGERARRRVEWMVRGTGPVRIVASGARVGSVDARVEL